MTISNLASKSSTAIDADLQRWMTILRHTKRMSVISRTTLQKRVDLHLAEKMDRIALAS